MGDYYLVDDDGQIKRVDDVLEWATGFEALKRDHPERWRVAFTREPELQVSTVFLGIDHSFGVGDPVLWETLVQDGPLAGEMDRYRSLADAKAGHAAMVERCRQADRDVTMDVLPLLQRLSTAYQDDTPMDVSPPLQKLPEAYRDDAPPEPAGPVIRDFLGFAKCLNRTETLWTSLGAPGERWRRSQPTIRQLRSLTDEQERQLEVLRERFDRVERMAQDCQAHADALGLEIDDLMMEAVPNPDYDPAARKTLWYSGVIDRLDESAADARE